MKSVFSRLFVAELYVYNMHITFEKEMMYYAVKKISDHPLCINIFTFFGHWELEKNSNVLAITHNSSIFRIV